MEDKNKIGDIILIEQLPDIDNDNWILVTDSQDTSLIREMYPIITDESGYQFINDYDSFFVMIDDGDYSILYGFYGIIPVLIKECTKLI